MTRIHTAGLSVPEESWLSSAELENSLLWHLQCQHWLRQDDCKLMANWVPQTSSNKVTVTSRTALIKQN